MTEGSQYVNDYLYNSALRVGRIEEELQQYLSRIRALAFDQKLLRTKSVY